MPAGKDWAYMFCVLLCTFGLVVFASAGWAQSDTTNGEKHAVHTRGIPPVNSGVKGKPKGKVYAIIIGVSQYKNIPSLQFADRDALAFEYYLRFKSGFNVDSANIRLFINEEATRDNIENAISDMNIADSLTKDDKLIFYFAGHGDYEGKVQKQGLLLLYNAPKENYLLRKINGDFLGTADLFSKFFSVSPCDVILIADACHSSAASERLSGGPEGGKITQQALEGMKLSAKIFSCRSDQYALEGKQFGGGRGLFSFVLMEGLYGMADANKDNVVTMREIQRYVEDNVPPMARPGAQDPLVDVKDPFEVFAKVDSQFLQKYITDKRNNIFFISNDEARGKRASWLKNLFNGASRDYKSCLQLIEKKMLDSAYKQFKKYAKRDSASAVSIEVRRALSAALQEKAAEIIIPMTESVTRNMPDRDLVRMAYDDLSKSAELLGERHYLAGNLKARLLLLNVMSMDLRMIRINFTDVIRDLKRSIVLEPDAPYTYYVLGNIFHHFNHLDSAKKYYQFYLDLIPRSSWAYNNMGMVCAEMGNDKEAMANFQKAISLDPFSGRTYNNIGLIFLRQKDLAQAKSNFTKAIRYWSDSDEPYLNMGTTCYQGNVFDSALLYLEKAYDMNPGAEQTNALLGYLYFRDKVFDKSAQHLEQALIANPNNEAIQNTLAESYYAMKAYESAYLHYERSLASPTRNRVNIENYGSTLYEVGKINVNRKNFDQAMNLFNQYISLFPRDAKGEIGVADIFFEKGQFIRSSQHYKKAYSLGKNNQEALRMYAYTLYYGQKYADALTVLRKFVANDNKNSLALFYICCCDAVLNKERNFFQDLAKSLELGSKVQILDWSTRERKFDKWRLKPEFRKIFEQNFSKEYLLHFPLLFVVPSPAPQLPGAAQ